MANLGAFDPDLIRASWFDPDLHPWGAFSDEGLAALRLRVSWVAIERAAVAGRLKVYLSGSWVPKPVKARVGASWVEKPAKVWTGSAWA